MKSFLCCCITLNFFSMAFCELKVEGNNTKYNFFDGLGGPVRVPGFYEKNETKQFSSKLGESCDWSDNCFAAYAICDKGKCACDGAFTEKDGICQPKTVFCPDPESHDAKAISTPKLCHIERTANSTIQNVGCTSNEFCFTHPISRTSAQHFFPSGHCCPLLTAATKLSAPVCPLVFLNDVFNGGNKNCQQCQPTMEQCVSLKVWNSEMAYTYVGRCCPLPCRDAVHSTEQLFNVDGQCFYHRKYVKENCDYSGLDFSLNDKHLDGLNSYQCEYECLRNIQCTHFTWSVIGCFLKNAKTTAEILQTFQNYNGAVCGYIEGRTR